MRSPASERWAWPPGSCRRAGDPSADDEVTSSNRHRNVVPATSEGVTVAPDAGDGDVETEDDG
jgi:hypothetical protein